MPKPTNPFPESLKIAFIGAHGVGKTTLVYGLAARLKARDYSLEVVVEVARKCPLPLNEATTIAAQSWILHTQIADEIAAQSRYPIVICDRSAIDNYVYLLLSHGPDEGLESMVRMWTESYDLLVHVPPVENDVQRDGTRATDRAFRDAVEDRLARELSARRIPVVNLVADERSGWLDRVEQQVVRLLEPPQLELLP